MLLTIYLNLERHRYEDEDNLPLINLLALTDYESGIAFFYRAYDGKSSCCENCQSSYFRECRTESKKRCFCVR